jgi:NADH-quinone oxidoreductase subunit N
MPSSRDLLMLFLALELVSAPGFLIAAFRKGDPRSNEAGLKFFLIGVLSTAVMLYGISLIYGITGGKTRLNEIGAALAGPLGDSESLVLASILFVVVGFAFKVSAVPFQFWAPDTYEGAPVPVAAFLATASKAAGFAGLLQLMFVAFVNQAEFWTPIFAGLSILTMTIGNLVALRQTQVVRLLAYSSIAQAGYMLLPFALVSVDNPEVNDAAFSAAILYILIYGVMTLGAFAVVIAMSRTSSSLLISDFAGLIRKAPILAIAMTTFMISLAGIPPTGGFWAKFVVFRAAIDAGGAGPWLAVVMLVNSVVSLVYYLAIPKQMLLTDGVDDGTEASVAPIRVPALVGGIVLLATIGVIAIGVYPDLIARFPSISGLTGG